MRHNNKNITLFEHQSIKLNQVIDGIRFDETMLKALQNHYGDKGVPYFSLIHNGIKFNEFVGVIQVNDTVIEVLPKADNQFAGPYEKSKWQEILIDMLLTVGIFDIHAPSRSSLKIKPNSILDLYFELFINETEYLLHSGLVKQYRKIDCNASALKGNLNFSQHIQQNLTHRERFYVRQTTYDTEHKVHMILSKAIKLLRHINTNAKLHNRLGALSLNFPEMPDISVTETTFEKIVFNRKNQSYKNAIEIARLLLMRYHPNVSRGKDYLLALMFDMNFLWERFIYASLCKHKNSNTTITSQTSKHFWKPQLGNRSSIRPDIVISKDTEQCIVLDTKWKNLNGYNPNVEDLRQMFVYHQYYNAKKVALVYPGQATEKRSGYFIDPSSAELTDMECSVISFKVETNIKNWQLQIANDINGLLQLL